MDLDLEAIQDLVIEIGYDYDKLSNAGQLAYTILCDRLQLDLGPETKH